MALKHTTLINKEQVCFYAKANETYNKVYKWVDQASISTNIQDTSKITHLPLLTL